MLTQHPSSRPTAPPPNVRQWRTYPGGTAIAVHSRSAPLGRWDPAGGLAGPCRRSGTRVQPTTSPSLVVCLFCPWTVTSLGAATLSWRGGQGQHVTAVTSKTPSLLPENSVCIYCSPLRMYRVTKYMLHECLQPRYPRKVMSLRVMPAFLHCRVSPARSLIGKCPPTGQSCCCCQSRWASPGGRPSHCPGCQST